MFQKLTQKLNNKPKFSVITLAVFAIAFVLVGSYFIYQSLAEKEGEIAADTKTKKIEVLTEHLKADSAAYKSTMPSDQKPKMEDMKKTAQERKAEMLRLATAEPDTFLANAVKKEDKDAMPEEVKSYVEDQTKLTGKFRILERDDFDKKVSETRYYLEAKNKKQYQLHFNKQNFNTKPEVQATVSGYQLDNEVVFAPTPSNFVVTADAAISATPTMIRKMAVILYNFRNDTRQPYTVDAAKAFMSTNPNSVYNFYKEASFGKLQLQGMNSLQVDVLGWYTIPYDNLPDCSGPAMASIYPTVTNQWGDAAEAEATKRGIDLSGYNYIFRGGVGIQDPTGGSCGFNYAYVGDPNGSVGVRSNMTSFDINRFTTPAVASHEIGHNLGLLHASSIECSENGVTVPYPSNESLVSTNCKTIEYGDSLDNMGNGSYQYHWNNAFKHRMNLFDAANIKDITTAGTQEINLQPQEIESTGVQMIRIDRGPLTSNGTQRKYLIVEFRKTYGFDKLTYPGIYIRLSGDKSWNSYLLTLDTTKTTVEKYALKPGNTFTDPVSKATVTLKAMTADNATVSVNTQQNSCVKAAPSVTAIPTSVTSGPGETKYFDVTVKNNNGSGCPVIDYAARSDEINAQFTFNPDYTKPSIKALASGESFTTRFSVTAASNITYSGTYRPRFSGYEVTDATNITTISVTYYLNATTPPPVTPDTIAPTVSLSGVTSGATYSSGRYTIVGNASDAGGIAKIEMIVSGKVVATCSNVTTCSYVLNIKKLAVGPHTVTVKAYDKAGNTGTNQIYITRVK